MTSGAILFWLAFLCAHLWEWHLNGRLVGLGLVAQESIFIALFLMRRRARVSSRSCSAWLVTIIGSFGTLAMRPASHPIGGLDGLYVILQVLGAAAAVVSLCSLGRSFGLVAADRGIQTGGAYRLVRHPVYASYLVATAAYVLENPSLANLAIFLLVWICQLLRIREEEKLLVLDPAYARYRARVRYRLVPGLY